MRNLSRVVWPEAMYLGPHHFQAQSQYFEDSVCLATSALWCEPCGLVATRLDAEVLDGTASLLHARDMFPLVLDSITLAAAPRRQEGSNTFLTDETQA
jgi:type VI secretion system protein ImpJ